ncbi:MAG: glycosyltransferase family 4 protein [Candidatus Levybacteria bacterium]|nr:glycosyltransferase family 4 protein [Candidatus Levybacteria bacterium]
MNILILNWRDTKHEWAGGGEVYISELAKRWIKMGHKVTLFCGQDVRGKLPSEETISGIKIYRKGGRFTLYLWAFIYYFTRFRKNTDVVVDVQNGIPFFTTIYCRKPKVAVVYHVHGKQFFVELPFPINIVGFIIERYLFPLFYYKTKIIAISKTTKDDLIERGFKNKNIEIVYCGINGKKQNASVNKFYKPTILYLGRIKKYKRVDLLIKIMPEVLKRVPNAHLMIAGWGTEASSITDITMRSITRRKVNIIGPVSEAEKKHLLSKAWVFVNPSIGEGWGISVIEANLYGAPAVAFDVAGLSESIRHGQTGYLSKDEKEFIDNICRILKNKELRLKLSKNAKKWANTFNWETAAANSLEVIKRVARNG